MSAITALPALRAGDPLEHRELLRQLDEVRTGSGMSQAKLGVIFGVSQPTMSRMLDGTCPMTPQQRSVARALVSLGSDGRVTWLAPYLAIEETASGLCTFEGYVAPGLLQTRDYAAHAIRAATPGAKAAEREQMVARRMARQKLLDREDPAPPLLAVVIGEAVLRNKVGDAGVMAAQMAHFAEMAGHPCVRLQVLPFEAPGSLSSLAPFVLASFADDRPETAYAEDALSGRQTEEKPDVVRLGFTWGELTREALRPHESRQLIEEMAGTWASKRA